MPETQLASMRLGSVDMPDEEEREGKTGVAPLIHIADGQSDELIGDIAPEYIIDDTHRQSLEDTLETYEFYTFGDQSFTQHLKDRNRIIIPDEDGTLREFIIYESEKYRDTEGYKMYVIGTASYLDLKKANVIRPGSFTGTASQHIGIALNDTEWRPGIVEVSGSRTIHRDDFTNPFDYLKTLAREFEGELRFRIEHNGNRITGRFVDLLERIGEWRGREIEFGKDLDGIRRIENTERIVTALIGLGPERDDGTRLEVFVEDTEALQRWGRPDPVTGELRHLIEVYEPESDRAEMTEEELRQYTRTELNKRINAVVTYECSVVDLENVPGMENKQIRFGDTIRIKDTKFNPPLYIEARVFEQERSIKSKAKKDIKLGEFVEYTEDEVKAIWNRMKREIRARILEYAEPQKIESPMPPPIKADAVNPIWIDTSKEPHVAHIADVENNEWVKITPTEASEVNAPSRNETIVENEEYNGLKWNKILGLIVERTDGKARAIMSGTDGFRIQKNVGGIWNDLFYVDSEGNVKFAGTLEGASGIFFSEGIYDGDFTKTIIDRIIILEDSYFKHEIHPVLATIEDKTDNVIYTHGYGGLGVNQKNGTPIAGITVLPEGYISIDIQQGYRWLNIDVGETTFNGNVFINSFEQILWTGQAYPLDTQTIIPSKPLSDCMTGWILRFQRYIAGTGTQDNNFHYIHIPKAHALFKEGAGIRITLGEDTDQTVTKYIYVYNDRIVGHASNNQNRSQNRVLTGVFEY